MDTNTIDVISLLEAGNAVQIYPQGYSMYPLLLPGRDQAIVSAAKCHHLRRGDVVLYRRDHSILVLHRIWSIKQDGLYLVGDNQVEVEGPIRLDQVKGKMVAVVRRGKTIGVTHPLYRLYAALWLTLRPSRKIISKMLSKVFQWLHIQL